MTIMDLVARRWLWYYACSFCTVKRMKKLIRPPAVLKATLLTALILPFAAVPQVTPVDQQDPRFRLEQVASGLGVPWGMAFLSPTRLLVSERSGSLRLINLDTSETHRVDGAPRVVAEGQGGLLDVATGPNHASEGWIYFTYSKPVDSEAATALARARLDGLRLVDWQDLLVTDSATGTRRHFGSRIAFDDDGHLFFGVGDRGERDPAQDNSNHIGAIMRLNLDGSVPPDNPFVGDRAARDEIWSYGHRNPQGLLFDSTTQRLWEIEHGPRGGDEINLILEGRNYG